MKKKRWFIAVAGLALVIVFLGWCFGWFEPRYAGMRASAYVFRVLDTNRFGTAVAEEKLKPMGAKLAVPALIQALKIEDSQFRKWHIAAHARSPAALRKILPAPRSVAFIRANAIWSLSVFGPDAAPAVPALVSLLPQSDTMQWSRLGVALSAIGPAAGPAVPAIITAVTNQRTPRLPPGPMLKALGRIDPTGERSAPVVVLFAENSSVDTRMAALDALGAMSRHQPSLATNLWANVRYHFAPVRGTVIGHLNNLGLLTRETLAPYLRDITNSEPAIWVEATDVFAIAGQYAEVLIPLLARAARHEGDRETRRRAVAVLRQYCDRATVPAALREEAVLVILECGSATDRWTALDSLRRLTPQDAKLVRLLIPLLDDPDPRMRGKAAEALAQLGVTGSNAAPRLRRLLQDDWLFVRDAATNALRAMEKGP